jgi:hypothetical protein
VGNAANGGEIRAVIAEFGIDHINLSGICDGYGIPGTLKAACIAKVAVAIDFVCHCFHLLSFWGCLVLAQQIKQPESVSLQELINEEGLIGWL